MAAINAEKIAEFPDMGIEVWAKWDRLYQEYNPFTDPSCTDFVASADTYFAAKDLAHEYLESFM